MATIDELMRKSAEVRNERGAGLNTAVRIGDVLLCVAALIQALQEGLGDEEAARSGEDSSLGGRITAETAARQSADSALGGRIDAEVAARQSALQEAVGRLLGTSSSSSAFTDPIVKLGEYDNYADFNAALDAIGSSADVEAERKHIGWCRGIVAGTPFYILTSVLSWANKKFTQIIMGGVRVLSNGLIDCSDSPGLLGRSRQGSSWGPWVSIGGGGDLSNYLTKTEAQATYALKSAMDALLTYLSYGSDARGAVTFNNNSFGIGSSAWVTRFFGDVKFGEGHAPKLIEFLDKASVVFMGQTILPENSYMTRGPQMYPLSHPDLNTQGSILPQRFGNLKIYEKLVYIGYTDGSTYLSLPSDAMPREAMPIRAALFGTTFNGTNGLMDGGNLFFGNDCWVYYSDNYAETGSMICSDAYILVQYYLPEGGYYY